MKKKMKDVLTWRYLLPLGVVLLLFAGAMFRTMIGVIGMVLVALGLFDLVVKFLRQETKEQEKATKKSS